MRRAAEQGIAVDDGVARLLGAEPGLCGTCRHARANLTRRGTAYLRCSRAQWDARLVRYPTLPVRACPGHERVVISGSG